MTTETAVKYPILDPSGKIKAWLDAGRGVHVWENQEIGVDRPDLLTPGDNDAKAHWAYVLKATLGPDDITFFEPVRIVKSWRETGQGTIAARRAIRGAAYKPSTREAAGGTFATRYTLKSYAMGSVNISPEGITPAYRKEGEAVPTLLDVEFRIGILEWSAKLA